MVATSEIGYYWPQNNELNLVHNVKVNENGNIEGFFNIEPFDNMSDGFQNF